MRWIKQAVSTVIGKEAEGLARTFLEGHGLNFVTQNYRCRTGEIDIIMQDSDALVFVEVKYRKHSSHGSAIEFFHASKRQKFESAVMYYLQENNLNPSVVPHRIDLVAIEGQREHPKIEWLKGV